MLQLTDHWIWDFWFATEGRNVHVFFLKAPKALGDPDLRHHNARIGHAVSTDLRNWDVLPDALGPGPSGAWDDLATWTGSVFRADDRWYMFYTGVSREDRGMVQRIGYAVSDDLLTWRKPADNPILEADPRWYEELDRDVWMDQAWRDPWVYFNDTTGDYRMLVTARAKGGPPDGRGVLGAARSSDLRNWEVLPPVSEPGDFGHLEVPQLLSVDGRYYVLFSAYEWANSQVRSARTPAVCGTHYLVGDSPTGPFRAVTDDFLRGDPRGELYAGRVVEHPAGGLFFLAFEQFKDGGPFVGALSDPIRIAVGVDGRLTLDETSSPVAPR